jgi:hypoxanthine phosphoribosyltransferase
VNDDLRKVLYSPEQIAERVQELALQLRKDYDDRTDEPVILVGILKGAAMFLADLARALERPVELEFMAISSYGASTSSSGVVRILKDLERDITGRHVVLVEDIIDSGLTLTWLRRNLVSRNPASLEIAAMFRKPECLKVPVDAKYIGFDVPNEFVVGYGLDYNQRYRELPYLGILDPKVYTR